MVDSNTGDIASASIVCDPTNYDWVEDNDPGANRPGPGNTNPSQDHADPSNGTRRFSFGNTPEVLSTLPPPPRLTPESSRTTDKAFVEFVYGESAHQTMMRLSNQFVPVIEEDADTLIYVGPPPKARGQPDHEYGYVKRAFEHPHLLKSDTLRKLNSAKFDHLLGPKSKRTQRKLQKLGLHKLLVEPEKIKYFIDLTPDIHDDEGTLLLLELSVPPGARSWHKHAKRFNVKESHVCGRDTLEIHPVSSKRRMSQNGLEDQDPETANMSGSGRKRSGKKDSSKSKLGKNVAQEGSDTSEEEQDPSQCIDAIAKKYDPYDLPEEDDYSQLRHHTGIVRLLQAIVGQDPQLNSAPKAWTFCMLAQFFECAENGTINGWVIDWLVQSANINFIQVNPSTAYRIGTAVKAVWLVRSSFCIMVGQKAFEHAKTFADAGANVQGAALPQVPRTSPITYGLDDDEINRVDHAALTLMKRIKGQLHRLLTPDGEWKNSCRFGNQIDKLLRLEFDDPEVQRAREDVETYLDHLVRRHLCGPLFEFDDTKGNAGNMFKPPMGITSYGNISAPLRPLTLQFWEAIRTIDFGKEWWLSVDAGGGREKHWARTLQSLVDECAVAPENASIPYVWKSDLHMLVDSLNTLSFRVKKTNVLTSPKKKVKFSPPSTRAQTYQPSSVKNFYHERPSMRPDLPGPAQPAVFPQQKQADDSEAEETFPLLRKTSHTSRFDAWDELKDDTSDDIVDGGGDDWEDVLVDLEAQPVVNSSGLDLPIRSRPAESQMSLTHAVGTFSREDARSKLPSMQAGHSRFHEHVDSNLSPTSMPRFISTPRGKKHGQSSKSQPSQSSDNIVFSNALSSELKKVLTGSGPSPETSSTQTIRSRLGLPTSDFMKSEESTHVFDVDDFPSAPSYHPQDTPFFTDSFLVDIGNHFKSLVNPILLPGFMADYSCAYDVPLNEIGTLTCLTDDEYKYLPLWAGGNDDGTGGVFDDGEQIPEAPEVEYGGFRGGAMGIIPGVGSTIGGSVAGSEFEEISTEVGVSTVGKASRIATDGEDTVMSLDE